VIVQYGGSFRGLKVKAAAEAGAVGTELFHSQSLYFDILKRSGVCTACIIYSDPAADGEITVENGHEPYPFGPARAPSSYVQFLSHKLSLIFQRLPDCRLPAFNEVPFNISQSDLGTP